MCREPPSLYKQGVAPLLAYQHNRYFAGGRVDVEQHAVSAAQPQLALGDRIGAELLKFRLSACGFSANRAVAALSTARPSVCPSARRSSITDVFTLTVHRDTGSGY